MDQQFYSVKQAAQARQMRQQTELMRQQAEALRQQNEIQSHQVPAPGPQIDIVTEHMLNGKMWIDLENIAKLMYISAFLDAVSLASNDAPKMEEHFSNSRMTRNEIAKSIDNFYTTPENLAIPIPYAISVTKLRSTGANPEEIETLIDKFRRLAAASATAQ